MNIRSLSKLPKRKVTIDEILDNDAIVSMADDIVENRNNIEDIVIIYSRKDSDSFVFTHNDIPKSRAAWMMETIKHSLLDDD